MSSEWESIQLGDIGRVVTGKTPPTNRDDFFGGDIPFLTPTDMLDGHKSVNTGRALTIAGLAVVKNCLVPKGVAVSCIGWQMGKSVLVNVPTVSNQQINTIIVDESRFDISFVYYLLASMRDQIFELGATATRTPIVNKSTFSQIKALVPSLLVQRQIAEFCAALDDRITLLRETNATLEAIAQALFKSWFVDFDPVHANAAEKADQHSDGNGQVGTSPTGSASPPGSQTDPTAQRTPQALDPATAALFPDSFEESELGLVPKGWSYSTVEQSFILTMGQSPPGNSYNEVGEGMPFYQGRTDFGFRFPKQRIFCTEPTRLAGSGDTLVSVRAPVGDVNIALEPCAIGRGVAGLRHPDGCQSFVFYAVRCLKPYFEMYDGEGTVFGSINKKDFQALPIIVPSSDILKTFESIVAPMDAAIENNEQKLRFLTQLRDTLLPRLISGQLRLPEAEVMVSKEAS